MSGLNAKKAPKPTNNSNRVQQELMEVGTEEARVVAVIDLGLQPQRPYKGQEKPPVNMVRLTYEFPNLFIVDENGDELEDKPRWLSEDIPFKSLELDLAKSTKRYKAIDPEDTNDGDFTGLIGMPCMVTVGQYSYMKDGEEKSGNQVNDVSPITKRKADKLGELVNPPQVFLLDDPDMELFESFPDWLKDKIKKNLEFAGSELEAALNGGKKKKPKPQEVEDDIEEPVEDNVVEDEADDWLD
tara:strand:- start:16797 stop:17522 length:726 start_codon:yes stop_codon:yes gene_type:complete